ncbi:MAG: T9SS type A sorting domain-containing protein [Ignavibacteriaceae bacterium]|nr:T9SS type A sorting domain-containing protein [Ignavibacteriaceae bacterium]
MQGATEMYFYWNVPPEVTGLVQDLINGTFVNVPIEGHGTYQITNFEVFNQLKLFVYYNNVVTDVVDNDPGEYDFKLEQNYPNPFNPSTKIRFTVPSVIVSGAKQSHLITLKVYDVLGHEVATLVDEVKKPGIYEVEFNTSDIKNLPSSGIYFYQIQTSNFVQTKKMIFLK